MPWFGSNAQATEKSSMNDNPLFEALHELCQFLDDNSIRYTLVGGLAVGIWGAPRATVDLDFLVSLSITDADPLVRLLKRSDRFMFIHERPMVETRRFRTPYIAVQAARTIQTV